MSSAIALKSLTRTPSKPSLSRRWSRSRAPFAVIGMPARSVNAGMIVATPAATAASNGGKWTSCSVRSEMSTEAYSRPAVTGPYAQKCFAHAASESGDDKSWPWKPRILAAAILAASHASSPGPSAVRPQRGSRETSSIGAKVSPSPSCAASLAASRAVSSQASGSNKAASARGIGNRVRCPWMTSSPIRSGMPSREFSTARRCISCVGPGPTRFSRLPMEPFLSDSVESPAMIGPVTAELEAVMVSWPSFSSSVMSPISVSIRLIESKALK